MIISIVGNLKSKKSVIVRIVTISEAIELQIWIRNFSETLILKKGVLEFAESGKLLILE